jgi:hypothetical protein
MWWCYDWVVVVVFRLLTQYLVVLWLSCRCCRPSVNTICGRIMRGLSNQNTTTYYVYWRTTTTTTQSYYDHILCLLTDDNNDNPIIIRPHIVFTGLPSVNTICGRIMIGLPLLSVSEHNMWSCYDWVVVVVFRLLTQYLVVLWLSCRCCRPSVNTGRQQQEPTHNTTTYCVYWRTTTTTTQS